MIWKTFSYISRGLLGILTNNKLPIAKKIALYFDYLKIVALVLQTPFNSRQLQSSIDKTVRLTSFGITVHYPDIRSFFFLFNEICCIGQYPPVSNLKTYIDLGANIGLSILWYHLFNPNMIIYAFEPDDSTYPFLKRNIKEANINFCTLYHKAVSNKIQHMKFYRILDPIQSLDSGLSLNQKLPFEISIVKTQKLSTLVKKIGTVSLVKIDIEGGEYDVFEDLFSTKAITHIKKIIFENHAFNKKDNRRFIKISANLQAIGHLNSQSTSVYTTINYWDNTAG